MPYEGQNIELPFGFELLEKEKESPGSVFLETDANLSYRDINSQTTDSPTYDSLDRLRFLHEAGSHRARVLLGQVAGGLVLTLEGDLVTNREEFEEKIQDLQNDGSELSNKLQDHLNAVLNEQHEYRPRINLS